MINIFNLFFRKSIKRVCEENTDRLLEKDGVCAVGIGHKVTKGIDTGEDAICVFVEHKRPVREMSLEDTIPKQVEGIQTDVIEIGGEIKPMHKKKHRPLVGGISGKVEGGSACSIGLIVFKDGKPYALTNEHCVHYPSGQNNKGKNFIQPSPYDGGNTTDKIGIINTDPIIRNDKTNKIDSCLIPLDTDYKTEVLNYGSYKKQWVEPKVGTPFVKIGRTTGTTYGVISHTNVTAMVNYKGSLGTCSFFPCVFALQNNYDIVNGGDSGSIILNEDGIIGQTFAAAPNLAIFLTGTVIRDELGVELENNQPLEGYCAMHHLWSSNEKTFVRLNLRSEPRLGNNIIKTMPVGTKISVLGYAGFSNGFFWLKIKCY